jgi:hypothetical protein
LILPRTSSLCGSGRPPRRVADLGAGDGTLACRLAESWPAANGARELALVDLHHAIEPETRSRIEARGWKVEIVQRDVFEWLEQAREPCDVLLANLFLHHFRDEALRRLLELAAERTHLFIACEPRRSSFALTASRLVRFIGCNAITRNDAPVSVRAGFAGGELSGLWPAGTGWELHETRAGAFSHLFVAVSRSAGW